MAGWALGLPLLTRTVAGYKAIALSVTVCLLLLGLALIHLASGRTGRRQLTWVAALAGFVSLYGLLEGIGFLGGVDLNLEDALTQRLARVFSIPFETMSPVAGLLLFLVGAAMAAVALGPAAARERRWLGDLAGLLALVATVTAAVFGLAYAYGAPLLYGGPALPIAVTSVLGALLLAVGTMAAGGRECWPLRAMVGGSTQARLLRAFVPLTVFAVLSVSVVDERLRAAHGPRHVLVDSVLAVAFSLLAGLVAQRAAHSMGDAIDRAQGEAVRLVGELARQHALLEAILENTEAHLVFLDRDFNFLRVNGAYARACRRAPEEFLGHNHFEFYPDAENEAIFRRVRDTGEAFSIREKPFEFPGMPERGVTYWDWTLTPIKGETGEVRYLVFSLVDVTEKVRQRERLVAAERSRAELLETLNQEISHRTKNNLAMVTGLLQMQIAAESDPHLVEVLQDTIARLYTFANVHDQLGATPGEVELLGTLRRVADSIQAVFGKGNVVLSIAGEEVVCPGRVGTTLCIVANELITNAIKHGAPGADGRLQVRARLAVSDAQLHLTVWNSGNPVAAGLDLGRQSSMGISLVQSLVVGQCRGTFTLEPQDDGTLARVVVSDQVLREGA
jgi:PAS domain S-box-containing protein